MTEIDLDYLGGQFSFEINLKQVYKQLNNYCSQYAEDEKMADCMSTLSELYHCDSNQYREPTDFEVFNSEEEMKQREEEIDYEEFAVSSWGNESTELVIVKAYGKYNQTIQSFRSKEEAEIWIEQIDEIRLVQTHIPIVFSEVGEKIGSPVLAWLQKYWWIPALVIVAIVLGFIVMKKDKPKPMIEPIPIKEEPPMVEVKLFGKPYPPTAT